MATGTGDRLARGQHRANFMATDGRVKKSTWDKAFNDFDYKKYIGSSNASPAGDAGISTEKPIRRNRA